MTALPPPDPDGLLEYSVVYTDRSLNHMSARFRQTMNNLSAMLRETYRAAAVAIVPGGGTVGMEAVARQFAQDKKVMVIRNGWFSYRWSQILESARLTDQVSVLTARPLKAEARAPFAPPPLDEVIGRIRSERPAVLFAPHVETAAGLILPDDYLAALGQAMREVDGLFVLDCIASGAVWVDMQANGVDVLLSAPQKGWSASPCAGLVMLSERAEALLAHTTSNSFALDLAKWRQIMAAFEHGGHAYHATMPTDALVTLEGAMQETLARGLPQLAEAQWALGRAVRDLFAAHGLPSVAAPGFEAPGVVVSYTDDEGLRSGQKFIAAGLQTAAGVPLQCGEPADFSTFRIGLFGLDKLTHPARTVDRLRAGLQAALALA